MSKRYFLLNKSDSNTNPNLNKVALVGQLFLKLEDQNLHISENGGPVLIFVQDDVVTVKVEAEVKDLYFNDHLVKKGGLYFLEKADRLKYKKHSIEVISEEALTQTLPDITEEKTRILVENSLTKVQTKPIKTKVEDNNHNDDIVFKVDSNKKEVTRTSIDINELLKKAKANKTNHKKFANKAKKSGVIRPKKPGSELGQMRTKKPQPLVLPKHKRNFRSDLLVGPFIRTFAFISEILLVIYTTPFLLDLGISDLNVIVLNLLNEHLGPYISKINSFINIAITMPYILSYAVISILSAILFSTSFPLFIIGVTTQGSFLEKRIKAFFRSILNLLTCGFLIFDLPVLVGKMTFKELLTRACIEYRSKFIKFLSLISLTIYTLLGIFHIPLMETVINDNFTYGTVNRSHYDETNTKSKDIFKVSKNFYKNFSFMGASNPKVQYLLVENSTSNFFKLKEYANIEYKDLKFLREKIALFSFFYPALDKYLNGLEVDPLSVKTNIVNLFESADILMTKDIFSIININIFSMNEVYKYLKSKNLTTNNVNIINDFNKIYKFGNEYTLATITNTDIKFISIESSFTNIDKKLDNLVISNIELFTNPLDQAIANDSNLLSLEEYSKTIEQIKILMIESKEGQSISTYNKFISELIENIPPNKGYIKDFLKQKMIL